MFFIFPTRRLLVDHSMTTHRLYMYRQGDDNHETVSTDQHRKSGVTISTHCVARQLTKSGNDASADASRSARPASVALNGRRRRVLVRSAHGGRERSEQGEAFCRGRRGTRTPDICLVRAAL